MSATTVTVNELAERRTTYHEADVVVVGAGVFGCAVAYAMAEQGRSVILLERWMKEPNRIVGELMQPGGVNSLRKLGLGHCIEDIDSVPCNGFNVFFHGQNVRMPYPRIPGLLGPDGKEIEPVKSSDQQKAELPRPEGRSFHHGRFITKLRQACLKHPNISVFETEVINTVKGEHNPEILGVETRTTDASTGEKKPDCFFGQLTIVADGYASRFRKQYIKQAPVVRSKFYALELLDCELPSPHHGHVIIGAPSPVLLYQIGTRETRALVDVPEKLPEASTANGGVRGYMAKVVLPALPASVRPSFRAALERDSKIPQSMPNSWLPPSKQAVPGLIIVGDAMNMRHPLTGGGMTVALNDVVLLRELLAPERVPHLADTAAVARAMATFHWRRKRLTSIINVLAMALYSLFAAQSPELAKLQRGCFAYFERGVVQQPMGMLGGLIPDPLVLAYHFFSVAFLAIWLDWRAVGLWKLPLLLWNAFWILWTASHVFLPVMYRELLV
ncbi:SE-domain-containing protein [Durotheca rogersii]|uniref:SE-domain-containing protein n=1 Tax=Durotheca rogersii TaxID=419775 RepID=UPI0022202BEA|nr:SE-domain-containing protein [Durotheca rogersii]KAI5866945.1 SE-domain-containing protein [Durotheca rogersii]